MIRKIAVFPFYLTLIALLNACDWLKETLDDIDRYWRES